MNKSLVLAFLLTLLFLSYADKKYTNKQLPKKTSTDKNDGVASPSSRKAQNVSHSETPEKAADISESKTSNVFKGILMFEKILVEEKAKLLTSPQPGDVDSKGYFKEPTETMSNCSVDINSVFLAATKGTPWALEMIDALGKPGTGVLRENLRFVGEYDECMDVETGLDFDGRFCTTTVWIARVQNTTFATPAGFYLGVCLPSSCGSTEVEGFLNDYLQSRPDITAGAANTNCHEPQLTVRPKTKIVLSITSIFAGLLVIATAYDLMFKRGNNQAGNPPKSKVEDNPVAIQGTSDGPRRRHIKREQETLKHWNNVEAPTGKSGPLHIIDQVLMSFSVYSNASNLLSTYQPPGSITCINGIRFISMMWIILLHTFASGVGVMDNLKPYLKKSYQRWEYQIISNSPISVDTFFTISGVLLTYLVLKDLQKKECSFGFFRHFYIHRFWRLTPPYILILVTYASLYKYVSDGPFWPQGGIEKNECDDTWWINLVYINNLFRTGDMCMPWTWYSSVDMQFYVISPLLFLPMYYFAWRGLLVSMAVLTGTAVCSGLISAAYELPPNNELSIDQIGSYFYVYYMKPYTRIGPYIIGMVTGYIMYRCECKARLPKWVVFLGWTLAVAIGGAVLFGLYDHYSNERLTTEAAAIYNALHKIGWGVSVCWLIFACANGYGGFINTFLSWKAFVPLSKLTYCAYMIHPLVIFYYFLSQRRSFYQDNVNVTFALFGIIVVTYAISFIASLVYEVPMVGLEKIFHGQGRIVSKKE